MIDNIIAYHVTSKSRSLLHKDKQYSKCLQCGVCVCVCVCMRTCLYLHVYFMCVHCMHTAQKQNYGFIQTYNYYHYT